MAQKLGMTGTNPSQTYMRQERGENRMPVEVVEQIINLTDGAVSHADLHEACLAWHRQAAKKVAAE